MCLRRLLILIILTLSCSINTTETWQGLAYMNASQDPSMPTLYMQNFFNERKNSENLYCSSFYAGYMLGLLIIIRNTCGNNGKIQGHPQNPRAHVHKRICT